MTGTLLHIHHHGNDADTVAGAALLAGLDWSVHEPAGVGSGRSGVRRLDWRGASTAVPSFSAPGHEAGAGAGALLAQMCLACERDNHDTNGMWLWIARVRGIHRDGAGHGGDNHETGIRWWIGSTDDGSPSQIVPEELHDTLSGLMLAVGGIATTSQLSGIGLCAAAADEVRAALASSGTELPEPVICTPGPPDRNEPHFRGRAQRSPERRVLMTGLAGAVLISGIWAGGLLEADEPVAVATVYTAPVTGSVGTACRSGLDTVFPRAPGWILNAAGCSRPGHLPPDLPVSGLDPLDVVIWRAWSRDGSANAVMADAAATVMATGWRHGASVPRNTTPGDRMFLWRTTQVAGETVDPSGAPTVGDLTRALSQTWADEPGAVSHDAGLVTVRVPDPPAHTLARLDAAWTMRGPGSQVDPQNRRDDRSDVELLSIVWKKSRTTLRLRPRTGEILP